MLFFDLDNTLIDRAAGFRVWASCFLRGLGRYSVDDMAWLDSMDGDGITSRAVFFEQVRERYGLSETMDALVRRYHSEFPALIPPPAEETFAALLLARENGYKTCIVTNGSRGLQEPKIISSGLAALLDAWCISEDAGVRKPDPGILRVAADLCGEALTTQSWMVGDRPETDVLCARRAGIQSVWVSRGPRWNDALPYRPTLAAETVSDAVARIIAWPTVKG